jgi:hypothetical protein
MQRLLRKFVTNARVLNIEQKVRHNPTAFVSLRDFEVSPAAPFRCKPLPKIHILPSTPWTISAGRRFLWRPPRM